MNNDIFTTLITDRTQSDVDNDTDKGNYNYTDWNRVESAAAACAELLSNEGYITTITSKTNWTPTDKPVALQMLRYISNVLFIQSQFVKIPRVDVPESMYGIDYMDANNIELFLQTVPKLIENMKNNYRECNGFNCGEE